MKKVIKFSVRLVLFVLAMVVMAPGILTFVEGPTLWPNFFGLTYVASLVTLYKLSSEEGLPKQIMKLYRIAFGKFFDL